MPAAEMGIGRAFSRLSKPPAAEHYSTQAQDEQCPRQPRAAEEVAYATGQQGSYPAADNVDKIKTSLPFYQCLIDLLVGQVNKNTCNGLRNSCHAFLDHGQEKNKEFNKVLRSYHTNRLTSSDV